MDWIAGAEMVLVPVTVLGELEAAFDASVTEFQELHAQGQFPLLGPLDEQFGWVGPIGAHEPDMVREFVAATYGLIEYVDAGVGRERPQCLAGATERGGRVGDPSHDRIVYFVQ